MICYDLWPSTALTADQSGSSSPGSNHPLVTSGCSCQLGVGILSLRPSSVKRINVLSTTLKSQAREGMPCCPSFTGPKGNGGWGRRTDHWIEGALTILLSLAPPKAFSWPVAKRPFLLAVLSEHPYLRLTVRWWLRRGKRKRGRGEQMSGFCHRIFRALYSAASEVHHRHTSPPPSFQIRLFSSAADIEQNPETGYQLHVTPMCGP